MEKEIRSIIHCSNCKRLIEVRDTIITGPYGTSGAYCCCFCAYLAQCGWIEIEKAFEDFERILTRSKKKTIEWPFLH